MIEDFCQTIGKVTLCPSGLRFNDKSFNEVDAEELARHLEPFTQSNGPIRRAARLCWADMLHVIAEKYGLTNNRFLKSHKYQTYSGLAWAMGLIPLEEREESERVTPTHFRKLAKTKLNRLGVEKEGDCRWFQFLVTESNLSSIRMERMIEVEYCNRLIATKPEHEKGEWEEYRTKYEEFLCPLTSEILELKMRGGYRRAMASLVPAIERHPSAILMKFKMSHQKWWKLASREDIWLKAYDLCMENVANAK